MLRPDDQKYFRLLLEATVPEKFGNLSRQQLEEYYNTLYDLRKWSELTRICDERLELLHREIQLRRLEESDAARHKQAIAQGHKILYWTKLAVAVGVVVPILVALIAEIPFSKLLPAKPSQASPVSSPTATVSGEASATPTVTEPPSESRTASPTPESTSTPEA